MINNGRNAQLLQTIKRNVSLSQSVPISSILYLRSDVDKSSTLNMKFGKNKDYSYVGSREKTLLDFKEDITSNTPVTGWFSPIDNQGLPFTTRWLDEKFSVGQVKLALNQLIKAG